MTCPRRWADEATRCSSQNGREVFDEDAPGTSLAGFDGEHLIAAALSDFELESTPSDRPAEVRTRQALNRLRCLLPETS
jgi:hypothetical protein